MSEGLLGTLFLAISGVLVAIATGTYALRQKKVPEPTPVEKLWIRLDSQDEKIETLRHHVEKQDDHIRVYRGAFLAVISWSGRTREAWTGSTPIVQFTPAEEAAVKRGMDLSELEALS